jgi:hypothetical protein
MKILNGNGFFYPDTPRKQSLVRNSIRHNEFHDKVIFKILSFTVDDKIIRNFIIMQIRKAVVSKFCAIKYKLNSDSYKT